MEKRNIAVCIILSIVTCGIYGIYWFVKLTDELKTLSNDEKSMGGGVSFLVTLITCGIYGWYWAYVRGQNVDDAKSSRGLTSSNSGILYIVLQAVGLGIIAYALMQDAINSCIDADGNNVVA